MLHFYCYKSGQYYANGYTAQDIDKLHITKINPQIVAQTPSPKKKDSEMLFTETANTHAFRRICRSSGFFLKKQHLQQRL